MTRLLQGFGLTIALALNANLQMAALRTAAGGNPDGRNGFSRVVSFLDNLADYLMWIGGPACAIGLITGFIMIAVGKQEGSSVCGGAVIGIMGVLCSKAIMS